MASQVPQEALEPIADAAREAGVEVYHAEFSGRELRVQVESAAGASVDTCSDFCRALTPRLDAVNFMRRQYTLEVSSPGIERRLYQPQDYAKAVNKHVKVLVRNGWVEGLLVTAGPGTVTIRVESKTGPETRAYAYADIRQAHIRVPDCELFARSRAEAPNPESNHQDTDVTKMTSSLAVGATFVSLCLCGELLLRFGVERIR